MQKQTVRDIDVRGKKALVRVDFNVPFDEKTGVIRDESRIKAALPTINYLLEQGARVILASHLGRPDGKVVEGLRMKLVKDSLSRLLGRPVVTVNDCIGPEAEKAANDLKEGGVLLLENVRFHPEEEANDPEFSRKLAALADIYVDDAFGTAHRKHASIVGVTEYLPAVAGFLMENELYHLGAVMENPARPFGGIFGGFKVSDKLAMLDNVIPNVDYAFIGGAMAATFLKAEGKDVGSSVYEEDQVETARRLMGGKAQVLLPEDAVVGEAPTRESRAMEVSVDEIPADMKIMDIGQGTVETFAARLKECKTIFWNGPLGVNEVPQFAQGTAAVAEFLARLADATVIIGGGSTSDVVTNMGLDKDMTFVSTGGGASLRFLSGKSLPGVEALLSK